MLHIALVEDNPADARMMQLALEQTAAPISVTVIDDGLKAIEYLKQVRSSKAPDKCDVVLLDLNLPRLSGHEVLEQIRACEQLKSLPVVVLSGSSDPADVNRCYRTGANSYIVKPVHLPEILATAARFVAYWSQCVELPTAGD
jgi:CheY-like chemotaxis protein